MRRPLAAQRRSGTVLVFTIFLMLAMMAFLAMAVDAGYLTVVKAELRRSADASAVAAACELASRVNQVGSGAPVTVTDTTRTAAGQFAGLNQVGSVTPTLAGNDVTIGRLVYPFSPSTPLDTSDPNRFNAVSIQVQRTAAQNGEVGLFFARALGYNTQPMAESAVAVFLNNFNGFRTPSTPGDTLNILPFALDTTTWDNLLAGTGTDEYRWDKEHNLVVAGASDGILEVNLYPQGTGSPGNRGTVDIGPTNNSTCDISRQIRYGISVSDMNALIGSGRSLEFGPSGTLPLNGDTGISAGVKDDLAAIVGQRRCIPLFSQVSGNGNNAEYTITGFAGVRIMYVKLTGSPSQKKLIVQPANVPVRYGVPASGETQHSYSMFSMPWLIR